MTLDDLGVLVVGHGTRDPVGQAQMRSLAQQIAHCLAPRVTRLGFLELANPTIEVGVAELAACGVRRLLTVPALLFRAGHADHDIPCAVATAATKHRIKVVDQTSPLELQTTVVELSAERFQQGLSRASCEAMPSEDRALALIARGSSSATAAAAMLRFAEMRAAKTPVREVSVGYAAIRQPTVEQALDQLATSKARCLVVQPHLLFEGEVFHKLCETVEKRRQDDNRTWVICQPLGAPATDKNDTRLAEVLADLAKTGIG